MKITIIEDDIVLAENLAKKLQKNGNYISIFRSKNEFYNNLSKNSDLFIIDLNLWEKNDWYEIIKWLRINKRISSPIIITSWYSSIEKKIYWLDLWADDYLTKPYSFSELEARIRSITRRELKIRENIINYRDIKFDIKTKTFISWIDKDIMLTKKDLKIIEILLINKNKIVEKDRLINHVWWDYDRFWVKDNTVNVTLYNLRNKLWNKFNLVTIIWEWYILKE